jgi:manganese efflux pump family protein
MRIMHDFLRIAAFVLPLGLDTFALSVALGLSGMDARTRVQTSLLFTLFEGVMPVIGFLIGAGLGNAVGKASNYIAAAALISVGLYMLWPSRDEERERERLQLLNRTRGFAMLGLGLSISLDELAIGFGIGLLRLPLLLLVGIIALQAFCAAQLGMRLGSRLGEEAGGWAERLAGLLLLGAAALIFIG